MPSQQLVFHDNNRIQGKLCGIKPERRNLSKQWLCGQQLCRAFFSYPCGLSKFYVSDVA